MERPRGTVTFDITIATIIVLMMTTTTHLILFWYGHTREHRDTMSEQTLQFLSEYLIRKLVYFCVLWWLLMKTITITLPDQGGEPTGPDWGPGFFVKNSLLTANHVLKRF